MVFSRSVLVAALGALTVFAAATVPAGATPSGTPPSAASPTSAAPAPSGPATGADAGDPACPFRHVPAPPVDASEVPAPGSTTPTPLPVPDTPVGGPSLAACAAVLPAGAPPPPAGTEADAWLIADLDSGKVLAAHDPHGRHRPASTIKVLLALVAIDQLDLTDIVTATEADAYMEGSAVGIGPGGRYTVRQLLQGLLMASGNDAAHALAGQLGGQQEAVELMNAAAAELGAADTRTASASGLDGPGMATSAYDMALIFRAAMDRPVFAELVAGEPIEFPGYPVPEGVELFAEPDPEDPDAEPEPLSDYPDFWLANDDRLLTEYPGALGGKTGFTDDAGLTYVGAAERDGRRLVVTMLAGRIGERPFYQRAGDLLDYGFALPADAAVGELIDPPGAEDEDLVVLAAPPRAIDASADGPGMRTIAITVTVVGSLVLALAAFGVARRRR